MLFWYSDLPNNLAANLINLRGKKTDTTFLGPTRLLISEIFPSKPDFEKNVKKSKLHGLIKT